MSRAGIAVVSASLSVTVPIVNAENLTYGVDTGIAESDNVTLAHTDRLSQTIAITDLDFDYRQRSQRLDADAKGDFSYLDYLQHAYGTQLLGRFDGSANLALIPQRLTWALQEDYGKAVIDPFVPSTPTNLESVNTVMTGPDLSLHLGGTGFLDVSARVAEAHYETSPFTNTRALASVAWGEKLSALSSLSINIESERVMFENTVLNTDFDRSVAFIRYELQGARTDLSTDLGAARVQQGAGPDATVSNNTGFTTVGSTNARSITTPTAILKLSRKMSPSAHLLLNLGREITDGSTSFSGMQGGALGVIGTAPAANTASNYISTYGSVEWQYLRNRTTLAMSGRWEKDVYAGLPALDHTIGTGEVRLQRLLTKAVTLLVTGRLYKTDYGNVSSVLASANTQTSSVTAGVTWRHGRALELKLAGEHTNYITSPGELGYRESRVVLTVGYRPISGSDHADTQLR